MNDTLQTSNKTAHIKTQPVGVTKYSSFTRGQEQDKVADPKDKEYWEMKVKGYEEGDKNLIIAATMKLDEKLANSEFATDKKFLITLRSSVFDQGRQTKTNNTIRITADELTKIRGNSKDLNEWLNSAVKLLEEKIKEKTFPKSKK